MAGLALTNLLRSVLAERGRFEEDTVTDKPTVGAEVRLASEERGVPVRRANTGASSGNTELAYLPRQRSCRVIAAGWLRRRSEPAAASQPAVPAQPAAASWSSVSAQSPAVHA